jgi:hypothetical protein
VQNRERYRFNPVIVPEAFQDIVVDEIWNKGRASSSI